MLQPSSPQQASSLHASRCEAESSKGRSQPPLDAYLMLFNTPQPSGSSLQQLLADTYRFEDPFHCIVGREAMADYLAKSHQSLGGMHFTLLGHAFDDERCLLRWRFNAQLRGQPWMFEGISELQFDDQGRVAVHRDFWDSGQHFYARLPLVGALIRWINRRLKQQLGVAQS